MEAGALGICSRAALPPHSLGCVPQYTKPTSLLTDFLSPPPVSFSDFKMSFSLPTGLGSSRRGGSCRTSLYSNTGGPGTTINNANTGECLLIYGMKPTEVHMSSPHRSWEMPDGWATCNRPSPLTLLQSSGFRDACFIFLDASDSSQEILSSLLEIPTLTRYVLFSFPGRRPFTSFFLRLWGLALWVALLRPSLNSRNAAFLAMPSADTTSLCFPPTLLYSASFPLPQFN